MAMQGAEEHLNAGVAAYRAGDLDTAILEFEETSRLDPSNVHAFNYLGAAYGALGKYNQAVGAFKMAEQLAPTDPKVHYNIAQAYEAAGSPGEAEYEYGKALEIDPHYARAQQALTALHARMQQG